MERKTIIEVALVMAQAMASRSEDPDFKVGAIALSHDNRIIAAAYNGLMPGFTPPYGFWDRKREERSPYMIHAEQNLCSLVRRNEVGSVIVTHMPCMHCMRLLLACGVVKVYYNLEYDEATQWASRIARFYGTKFVKI